jgi:hypothetical protein
MSDYIVKIKSYFETNVKPYIKIESNTYRSERIFIRRKYEERCSSYYSFWSKTPLYPTVLIESVSKKKEPFVEFRRIFKDAIAIYDLVDFVDFCQELYDKQSLSACNAYDSQSNNEDIFLYFVKTLYPIFFIKCEHDYFVYNFYSIGWRLHNKIKQNKTLYGMALDVVLSNNLLKQDTYC